VKIIDLSQEIYQGMPVWPGHIKTVIWDHDTHESTAANGYSWMSKGIMMCDHGPTHVDAINHIDPTPGAPAINEIPLEKFYTDGLCLDVSEVEPGKYITKGVLQKACEKAGLTIKKGDTVILYTGHYPRRYNTPEWLTNYAGLDREGTLWLCDQGIVNIGIDAPSIDTPKDRTFPAHVACRERSMLNIENLGDLRPVVGKRFKFIGFPLKIRGGTGSPIRAVAILDE
jgi:kynurenine formamidase